MSRTVSARIEDAQFEEVLEYSNRNGISVNEFLKIAISEKLRNQAPAKKPSNLSERFEFPTKKPKENIDPKNMTDEQLVEAVKKTLQSK